MGVFIIGLFFAKLTAVAQQHDVAVGKAIYDFTLEQKPEYGLRIKD